MKLLVVIILSLSSIFLAQAAQCSSHKKCKNNLCCSQYGYCGSTYDYCGPGCKSQCHGAEGVSDVGESSGGVASIVSSAMFDQMLKHRNDPACHGRGFYTYNAFIAATNSFPAFGTTGSVEIRKREVAAFLAQTSHETTGGWATAPDGQYAWGYCFIQESGASSDYCVKNSKYPCTPGKKYYGRGPIQISYNYNYGQCGKAIGQDLLHNPDLVATDATISFKTALWFWMTPQSPKPSSHAVITGQWSPSGDDKAVGRESGYGAVTNIINGGVECGKGANAHVADRIGFFKRYCDIMGVSYGPNLDCYNVKPY
ncbi:hypothetical protein LUZ60_007066 [Juncus effusus]|nr:hypothetical protein LUZ60_007066 [Juncus effusus]